VSLIIVPRGSDAKPLPSLQLIQQVEDYLAARQMPTADLVVVGPDYVRVDIQAEVALASLDGASEIQSSILSSISGFLHPLTGGSSGTGWDFGRTPHKSDLYRLIESVKGVDHIRTLTITATPDHVGAAATGRFLVYSGEHTIDLVFGEV